METPPEKITIHARYDGHLWLSHSSLNPGLVVTGRTVHEAVGKMVIKHLETLGCRLDAVNKGGLKYIPSVEPADAMRVAAMREEFRRQDEQERYSPRPAPVEGVHARI